MAFVKLIKQRNSKNCRNSRFLSSYSSKPWGIIMNPLQMRGLTNVVSEAMFWSVSHKFTSIYFVSSVSVCPLTQNTTRNTVDWHIHHIMHAHIIFISIMSRGKCTSIPIGQISLLFSHVTSVGSSFMLMVNMKLSWWTDLLNTII